MPGTSAPPPKLSKDSKQAPKRVKHCSSGRNSLHAPPAPPKATNFVVGGLLSNAPLGKWLAHWRGSGAGSCFTQQSRARALPGQPDLPEPAPY